MSQKIMAVGHAALATGVAVARSFCRGPGTSDAAPAMRAPFVKGAGAERAHDSAAFRGNVTCTKEGNHTTAKGIKSESASAQVHRKCRHSAERLAVSQAMRPTPNSSRLVFQAIAAAVDGSSMITALAYARRRSAHATRPAR